MRDQYKSDEIMQNECLLNSIKDITHFLKTLRELRNEYEKKYSGCFGFFSALHQNKNRGFQLSYLEKVISDFDQADKEYQAKSNVESLIGAFLVVLYDIQHTQFAYSASNSKLRELIINHLSNLDFAMTIDEKNKLHYPNAENLDRAKICIANAPNFDLCYNGTFSISTVGNIKRQLKPEEKKIKSWLDKAIMSAQDFYKNNMLFGVFR